MLRSERGAISAPVVVLIALIVVLAGAGLYVFMSGARDTADAAADVVTGAPQQANVASVAADAQNLRLAVETAVVDAGGTLPKVTFTGGHFVVTGSSDASETVPASSGVESGGITGASGEDYCVWVSASDGTTMHTNHSGQPEVGPC